MPVKEAHYKQRTATYGMGHTRRDRILALAAGSGMRVLDVGCANGALGSLIKEKSNWVGGIELSDRAIEPARNALDQVWQFDIEGAWPHDLQRHDMNLVILGEVIEHVFDPVAILKSVRGALEPGGSVIITTPNFLTWTNRLRFLFGDFRYQEQGMFDFGHIRWFTYNYLKEVLAKSGFEISEERHIIFPGKLTRLLKYLPSLFAWQFIVKADKA